MTHDEIESRNWTAAALCAQVGDYPFFGESNREILDAKAICMRCLVRTECLTWALRHDRPPVGTWGGESARSRRRLIRRAAREGITVEDLALRVVADPDPPTREGRDHASPRYAAPQPAQARRTGPPAEPTSGSWREAS